MEPGRAIHVGCLFAHFAPEFAKILEPKDWVDLKRLYAEGSIDADLLRKLSEKDDHLTIYHFKFLVKYGIGVISVPTPSSQFTVHEDPAKWLVIHKAKAVKELTAFDGHVFRIWDVPPNNTLLEHAFFHNT